MSDIPFSFREYTIKANATRVYPQQAMLIYPALGLNGEAGEVAEKIKKMIRDRNGPLAGGYPVGYTMLHTEFEALVRELGDVLWYINALAEDLGSSLEEVAKANVAKLRDRAERGVVKGEGDER